MPITSVTKDADSLTMTVVADFAATPRRLWDAYLDPRLLERFWGPPTYPAVFTRHDGCVGGRSEYAMTGPDGDVSRGYWEWLAVDELKSFEVLDGFANPDGSANPQMPSMRMTFAFEAVLTGSRVSTTTYFNSPEELDKLLGMGMEQGMTAAMGQMDAVLADLAAFAAGDGTTTQILSDTQVRISRIVRGAPDAVWRAHQDPALLRQWLLGPEGWTMPVCDVATEVGQTYRYEWEKLDGEARFGFTGTLLDCLPPHRSVTTETMIGTTGPSTTNELTFTPVQGGTLLSMLITYPDSSVRDAILATGMTAGMEASYARLGVTDQLRSHSPSHDNLECFVLSASEVIAFVSTTDLARARAFYEDVLGLPVVDLNAYACVLNAHGTMLRVTAVAEVARAGYTVLGWRVADISDSVTRLESRGVAFARFDGMEQDDHGVWTSPHGDRIAWFSDPDANVLSLTEFI